MDIDGVKRHTRAWLAERLGTTVSVRFLRRCTSASGTLPNATNGFRLALNWTTRYRTVV
jgi:hypothetical protein